MLFSSLVILFRVLKVIRLQDSIGSRAQLRYLFSVACIAAANQCDKNILGRPLFIKSLAKATFIAQNYIEIIECRQREAQSRDVLDVDNFLEASEQPFLFTFEQWDKQFFEHLIQMYAGVLQLLDLRIEVVYPVAYIEKAIAEDHVYRDIILQKCREILIHGMNTGDEGIEVEWAEILNMCLFHHPRVIAQQLFDLALNACKTDDEGYLFNQSEIEYIVYQGILQIDLS